MSGSYIVFVLTLHVIPFLCTLCAYLWMVTVVRRHVTAIKQIRRTAGRRARGRSTSRAVVTTLIVVGVYFLCWAPIGFFTMSVVVFKIDRHLPSRWSADVLLTYLLVLAVSNSIYNPLIYAFKLDIIRRQFRASVLFRCLKLCCKVNRR
ncbi:melanocortin receptor 5-like [Crassostrea virginica]